MCVLYVSFGSKVRPRTFGCVAMRSAVLFIFRPRLLLYSAGSGVNRVQGFQRQQPTSGGTVRSSDLQIVVNTSFQTVSSTVFRTRVSLQRLS